MKVLEITNLSIGYNTKSASIPLVSNLNASLLEGELTCLIGANGVGKSTLLRTLSGFQEKLAGKIYIAGKEIETYSEKEMSRTVGVVLTEKVEAYDMTVRELIGLGRSPYTGFWGKLSDADNISIDKAIDLVNIRALEYRYVQTLSDGERQKVMIAKALAQETSIILLDEPTAFLDYPSKVEIMQLLSNLTKQTNKAIFLSTHDLELALQLSDKLWLMDKQKGIEMGSTIELAEKDSLTGFFNNKYIVFDKEECLYRIVKNV